MIASKLLLQLLAAFVIIGLIIRFGALFELMVRPFKFEVLPGASGNGFHALAAVAYFGYLINTFRQLQSFGIMAADPRFESQVGSAQTRPENIVSFLSLISVLVFPTLLVLSIQDGEGACDFPSRLLLDSLPFTSRGGALASFEPQAPAFWILAACFMTAMSFRVWDAATYVGGVSRTGQTTRKTRGKKRSSKKLIWRAYDYSCFTHNWIIMANWFLWVSGIVLAGSLVALLCSTDSQCDLRVSTVLLYTIIIVTWGYWGLDYSFNRDFYFPRHR